MGKHRIIIGNVVDGSVTCEVDVLVVLVVDVVSVPLPGSSSDPIYLFVLLYLIRTTCGVNFFILDSDRV